MESHLRAKWIYSRPQSGAAPKQAGVTETQAERERARVLAHRGCMGENHRKQPPVPDK